MGTRIQDYYGGESLDNERDLVEGCGRPSPGSALAVLNRTAACWASLFHIFSSLSA